MYHSTAKILSQNVQKNVQLSLNQYLICNCNRKTLLSRFVCHRVMCCKNKKNLFLLLVYYVLYTLDTLYSTVASIPIFEMVIEPKQSSGVDTVDSISSR